MGSVEIKGLSELHRALQDLPAKVERNVLRGALRAGAQVMEAEAQRLVPVAPPTLDSVKRGARAGELKRSIRITLRANRSGAVRAQLKAGNKVAWYAHLVEFGTARHWIKPKNRKSLFLAGLAKEVVDHPGAKPKPFMRPAFDRKWRSAIEAMADYIRGRLPREIRKAGQ